MTISDTERKNLIRRSAEAISQLQDGEDAIGVLSGIYCGNLPDKSPRQGKLMARELLNWIGRFQQSWDEALDEPEAFLCETIADSLAQLPLEEQCDFLAQELGIQNRQEACESLRDTLLQETAQQMLKSEALPGIHAVSETDCAWKTAPDRNVVKQTVGEEMFLAVTAMVIYTMAKNGELSGAPEHISLPQVTIGVCAEDKLAELRWAAENGQVESRMAESQLKTLKAVCISIMLAAEIVVGVGGWLLGKPPAAVAALCGYVLLWLGVVLSIYYKAKADMIKEEAAQIPYREVVAVPVEVPEKRETRTVAKHLPWPEQKRQKNERQEQIQPKAYTES